MRSVTRTGFRALMGPVNWCQTWQIPTFLNASLFEMTCFFDCLYYNVERLNQYKIALFLTHEINFML